MLDSDSFVQEAACTSLIHIIDKGPEQTLAHISLLIDSFKQVIDVYTGASLISLLDAIGQLAQSL